MLPFLSDLSANLFDAFLGVFFILTFCKCTFKEHKIASLITVFLCFAISTVYLFISVFSLLQSILIFIVLLIFSLSLKSKPILPKILAPIIFEVVLIIVSTLCITAFGYIFGYRFNDFIVEVSALRYLSVLICKILLTVSLWLIVKLFALKTTFHAVDLVLYLFAPLMTVVVLYTFMRIGIDYNIDSLYPLMIFSVMGLIIVNAFSLILFMHASKNAKAKYELELFRERQEAEQQKYTELKSIYEQISAQRHDFQKQLTGIKKLIQDENFTAVSDFLEKSEETLTSPIDYTHTGNRMIDYVINSKINANPKYKFIVFGTFESIGGISELDIASLFGNIIDNALEGCAPDSNVIEIEFFIKNNYQNIICKNPIAQSVLANNPSLLTSKEGAHGYGVKSIKRIVENAAGFVDFFEENNTFCVHIALPHKV